MLLTRKSLNVNKDFLKYSAIFCFLVLSTWLNAQLVVDFKINDNGNPNADTICIPDTRSFLALCSYDGNPITLGNQADFLFTWNLNPKNTNIAEFNPTVTYDQVGLFTISLTVKHIATGETKTVSKPRFVEAFEKPKASYSNSPVIGCAPLMYMFNDASTSLNGAIVSYKWSISGGGIKTDKNPLFTFISEGVYNLTLQIVDEVGCRDDSTALRVVEVIKKPEPKITIDPNSACEPPLNVNLSTDLPASFGHEWTVESIATPFNGNNVVANMTTSGAFDVNVKITGALNCEIDSTFVDAINISKPVVDFTSTEPGCLNSNVTFTNTTTGSTIGYRWEFGDGIVLNSNNKNVNHKYIAPGSYNVTLTALTANGLCDVSITKTITIEDIRAKFTLDKTRYCQVPAIINFDASSSTLPAGSTIEWIVRDPSQSPIAVYNGTTALPAIQIDRYGVYDVQLIVRSPSGCVSSIFLKDYIHVIKLNPAPVPDVVRGCAPLDVNFTDQTNFQGFTLTGRTWDFDDGSTDGPSTTNGSIFHTFKDTGTYKVKYTMEFAEGCLYEKIVEIKVGSRPDIKFSVSPKISCAFDSTEFLDSSSVLVNGIPNYDLPDEWIWNFKQGGTQIEGGGGRQIYLQHRDSATIGFDTAYTVELIVGWNGCYDTLVVEDAYHKLGPIVKQRRAEYDCTTGKIILEADTNRSANTYWQIMGNDSIVSNLPNDTITLPPGYYVFRTVSNNPLTGCMYADSLIAVDVPIDKLPEIELVGDKFICMSDIEPPSINCNRFPSAAPNACQYFFNVLNVGLSDNVITTVRHESGSAYSVILYGQNALTYNYLFRSPNRPGKYFIESTLISTNGGCTRVVRDTVTYFYPEITVENEIGGLGGCAPLALDLNTIENFDPGMVAKSYDWTVTNPSGTVILTYNTDNSPPPLNLNSNGIYNVDVKATAIHTASGLVCPVIVKNNTDLDIVVADPKPNFSLSKLRYCVGDSIEINNLTQTPLPLYYKWILETGETSTDSVPTLFTSVSDTINITLEVTDSINCTASITIQDTVLIEPTPTSIGIRAEIETSSCPPLATELYPIVLPSFADYSFQWYVDGENRSVLDTAIVVKTVPGTFGASLVVTSPAGCTDSVRIEDVLTVSGPAAELTIDKDTICVGDEIQIDIINAQNINAIQYVYGDGSFENSGPVGLSRTHKYTNVTGEVFVSVFLDPITAANPLGCNVLLSKKIFINEILADFDISNDSLCGAGEVTVTDISIGSNYESQFSVVPTGTNYINQSSFTNNYSEGIYTFRLKISDAVSGCENEISKNLWVFPETTPSIDPDSILCAGEKIVIRAAGGVTYEWTDPESGSLDTNKTSVVEANPTNTITYTVKVTDANECSATESITIFRDKTNLEYDITDTVACEQLQLNVVNTSTGNNIKWDFGNGDVSSVLKPNYTYIGAGVYNGSVELYDLSPRCKQTDDFIITINPAPAYTKSADEALCLNESVQIDVTGLDVIAWSVAPATQTAPIGFNSTVIPTEDVVYTFTITDTTTLCTSTDKISMTVDNPKASFEIDLIDSCGTSTVNILNPSSGTNRYFIPDAGLAPQFPLSSYTYTTLGNHVITYVVYDRLERCADTAYQSVNVHPIPSILTSNDVAMCNYQTAVLSASGGTTYKWTPSTGILGLDNASEIVVDPDNSTTYKVVVGNSFLCFDSAEVQVDIHPDYEFDTIPDTTIIIGEFVDLDLNPSDNINITWTPDTWLNCTDCSSQTIQPLKTVCYTINLVDLNACYPREIKPCITIDERYSMDVPKAFTPNNDNVNDVIFVRGFGIRELEEFAIFNRWGEVVFKSEDISIGWDGFYKGAVQNDETYVYRAKVIFWNGEVGSKSGYITLLK